MNHTALLVVDIQRAAFDGVRCPPIDAPQRLIANAVALLDAARAGGHPVVFVQHTDVAGEPFEKGTPHWELHEALLPADGEHRLEKHRSSSFDDTELDATLKRHGVGTLVVCGLQSEFCVSNTTRAALERGYAVQVASDGHSTWPSEGRSAALIEAEVNAQLGAAGATVEPTVVLAQALRGSA